MNGVTNRPSSSLFSPFVMSLLGPLPRGSGSPSAQIPAGATAVVKYDIIFENDEDVKRKDAELLLLTEQGFLLRPLYVFLHTILIYLQLFRKT